MLDKNFMKIKLPLVIKFFLFIILISNQYVFSQKIPSSEELKNMEKGLKIMQDKLENERKFDLQHISLDSIADSNTDYTLFISFKRSKDYQDLNTWEIYSKINRYLDIIGEKKLCDSIWNVVKNNKDIIFYIQYDNPPSRRFIAYKKNGDVLDSGKNIIIEKEEDAATSHDILLIALISLFVIVVIICLLDYWGVDIKTIFHKKRNKNQEIESNEIIAEYNEIITNQKEEIARINKEKEKLEEELRIKELQARYEKAPIKLNIEYSPLIEQIRPVTGMRSNALGFKIDIIDFLHGVDSIIEDYKEFLWINEYDEIDRVSVTDKYSESLLWRCDTQYDDWEISDVFYVSDKILDAWRIVNGINLDFETLKKVRDDLIRIENDQSPIYDIPIKQWDKANPIALGQLMDFFNNLSKNYDLILEDFDVNRDEYEENYYEDEEEEEYSDDEMYNEYILTGFDINYRTTDNKLINFDPYDWLNGNITLIKFKNTGFNYWGYYYSFGHFGVEKKDVRTSGIFYFKIKNNVIKDISLQRGIPSVDKFNIPVCSCSIDELLNWINRKTNIDVYNDNLNEIIPKIKNLFNFDIEKLINDVKRYQEQHYKFMVISEIPNLEGVYFLEKL